MFAHVCSDDLDALARMIERQQPVAIWTRCFALFGKLSALRGHSVDADVKCTLAISEKLIEQRIAICEPLVGRRFIRQIPS